MSLVTAAIVLTSIFSPATLLTAQGAASGLRSSFQDNAAPGGINEKFSTYVPKVYDQVQSWWNRLFPETEELRGLKPTEEVASEELPDPRCRVYTYYDKKMKSEDTEALLQVWLKAWWSAGMHPVILTNEMSTKHPHHKSLHEKYTDTGIDMTRLDAVLAMAQMEFEGSLVANYVFPMAPPNDPTLVQMRQCQVLDVLTKYRVTRDDLLRGSSMAYKILVKALVDNVERVDPERVRVLGIEGVPGANFRELEHTKSFAVYDPETVKKLYPKLFQGKPVGKGGKSFSFVKNQLAALVNGHLQDNFLINHRNGIEVLDPDLGIPESGYLARPSLRIGMEMSRCNLTPLPKTCAPQHTSQTTKCMDCSQIISSAFIKQVPGFVPKNHTFFIGTVPHPLTTLASGQEVLDFSAQTIRGSPRDIWSRKSITAALPPKSGAIRGLVFLSNSLWANEDQGLPDAQSWHLAEQEIDVSALEYDVGFTLPELRASLDSIERTPAEKSTQFQAKRLAIREMISKAENATMSDAISVVEAWSQFDAGAHQLIKNYLEYKKKRLDRCKAENRDAFAILELK